MDLANTDQTVTFFWVLSDYLAKRDGQIELKSDVMSEDSEEKLNQLAYSGDRKESNAALWLMLLLRLTAVTTDERPELRNTAIQTLLRIFDANGDYLSAEAWSMCFHHVIFKMLIAVASHLTGDSQSYAASDRAAWIDTTIVVLAGVSSLLSNYIHVLASHESFSSCWASLLDNFEHLLDLNKLEVSTAVFKALHQILEQANNGTQSSAALDEDAVKLAWDLWTNEVPTAHGVPGEKSDENNQDCLLAYVLCFQEIYRLARANVDVEKTTKVLRMLNGTVRTAQLSSYSSDVDYLTPLQTKVLESFNMLRTDIDGVPAAIIDSTADLCRLAFDDPKAQVAGKVSKPTYVALSREASIFLAGTIKAHYQDNSIYSSGSVLKALDALSMPIKLKYAFPIKTTKNIQPCRLSTVTSLDIIRSALPYLTEAQPPSSILHPIWDTVIQIYSAILSADTTGIPVSTILEDEQLDILYSRDLAGLIIPALGSEEIPDHTRRKFTAALFRASIIHEPAHGEIPEDGRELLARIYDPLRGRTVRLPPTARTKMAYVAFHQLADLVAIYPIGAGPAGSKAANASSDSHSSTVAPERVLLARAASPYFILRCALTLRAYYADQPLRGMMPQPISQRAELLKVLERMVDMQAEDEGIPDLKGVESTGGKHLCRLFPLLVKVAAVRNGNDAKVKDLTAQALQRVGWGFGL